MTAYASSVIHDDDDLLRLEPAWWDLWRRTPSATPFQSPAWVLSWWRVFHPGTLRAVAIHDRERLVALAPLYLEDGRWGLRLLPVGISLSDYLDAPVDPAHPGAAEAILETIQADIVWDSCSFEELAPGSALLSRFPIANVNDKTMRQSACPVLVLPDVVEHLGECVPARKLRKLRMARNRAARRKGFSISAVDPSGTRTFLDELFRLHGARWQQQGETGVLAEHCVRSFHEAAAPALARAGLARMLLMSLEGRIAGAYYGFSHRDKAFAYLGGFDPEFAFESPGTILMGQAIEAAIAEGCSELHFLRGREPYKYEWGAIDRWSLRRTLTREAVHA
ncbi:GNAT family N-acetyltransferase [Microvirga subterranea]|uniref:CelD/BcsL family acetyltransferase involved in cellulose biosynthesis n=1 Tax=Microvirga subterranea TaxID=186651 RepID=A0A370HNV6_9HYPH|nr:GNAT family N-acetyltransferase [Microvirga subterranea]RDI60020.1 CelD/BcsL family acetyltransferase involved in cellulose biosynthesis [Microvirga subterranea]